MPGSQKGAWAASSAVDFSQSSTSSTVTGSAQPASPSAGPAFPPGTRNTLRKDNSFFSLDWRLQVPFKFGDKQQYQLVPVIEMFNTTNSTNNINPLSTAGLFNFDGFLRKGVGDPRQMQLALRFLF